MLKFKLVSNEYRDALITLGRRYGFELSEKGIELIFRQSEENRLEVTSRENSVVIEGPNLTALLRGVGETVFRRSKGEFFWDLRQKIHFNFNGVMVDCSRNGVLNVSYAKALLEQMAIMGHSVLMLYMEDVYEVEGEPYFGYLRGRYSKAELKELDDYADGLGIELIPCIQTLAHLEQFLVWERAKSDYVDIDNILYVGSAKVNDLLERMIKQLAETFRSNRIHIGMDEAYNLGRGRYADEHGLRPKTEIMHEHLGAMLELTQKYGLKPIIWDDMFFSQYSGVDRDSYSIPEGIDLMYWDYYNNHEEHYTENLKKRREISKQVMFAGGAWRWIGYAPHHGKTWVSTNAALIACKKAGISEVLTTSWADDGCECPVSPLLFGAALFAEHSYHENVDEIVFKERLEFITGLSFEGFMRQQEIDVLPEFENKATTVTPGKCLFYEDLLVSKFVYHTKTIQEDLTTHYGELEAFFKESASKLSDPVLRATQEFYSAMSGFMMYKWNLGLKIYELYHSNQTDALRELANNQLSKAINRIDDVLETRRNEWGLTNKELGFEVLEIRLAGIKQRMITSKNKILSYVDGQIDGIEALEEGRLPVIDSRDEGMGEIIHFNNSIHSMTAGKIGWH